MINPAPIEFPFSDTRIMAMASTRFHGNMQVYRSEGQQNRHVFMRYIHANSSEAILVTPRVAFGTEIRVVHSQRSTNFEGIDGLITSQVGVFIGVPYADCIPMMMAGKNSREKRTVGVLHIGYENTLKNMSATGANAMDVPKKKLEVCMGPSICGRCYEFSAKHIHLFDNYPRFVKPKFGTDKFLVDLVGINKFQLMDVGVPEKNIKIFGSCTYETRYLFSARRDRANPPRECGIAVIGIKRAA